MCSAICPPFYALCVIFSHSSRLWSVNILHLHYITWTPVYPVLPTLTPHILPYRFYTYAFCDVPCTADSVPCTMRVNCNILCEIQPFHGAHKSLHHYYVCIRVLAQLNSTFPSFRSSARFLLFTLCCCSLRIAHDIKNWQRVLVWLQPSTKFISTKRGTDDHSLTRFLSSCAWAFFSSYWFTHLIYFATLQRYFQAIQDTRNI